MRKKYVELNIKDTDSKHLNTMSNMWENVSYEARQEASLWLRFQYLSLAVFKAALTSGY